MGDSTDHAAGNDGKPQPSLQQERQHQHQHPQRDARLAHLCVFGTSLPSDTVVALHKFMMKYINYPHVEFEGSLGMICRDQARLNIGVMGTTPIKHDCFPGTSFVSGIQGMQFKRLNEELNKWASAVQGGPVSLSYTRTREIDHFHADRVRVSVDTQTKKPLRAVRKQRIESLDIHVPSCQYDVRLSASSEQPCGFPTTDCTMVRVKDRISYTFSIWSLDITSIQSHRVSNGVQDEKSSTTHELELEIADTALIVQLASDGRHGELLEICNAWLNNLYMLSKTCNSPSPQHIKKRPRNG
ncbi:mRNA 5'-phosphatase [Plasmodiophora brassicae]|uniref:mRNA 5'-phosphatase n=1 Tax=Plasmodiophora brassicae TaxID=37360 RepID=A0A0G4J597_PLABS|nr:hypothetical protein PBRA_002687 [Plasmodiophora brassicae]